MKDPRPPHEVGTEQQDATGILARYVIFHMVQEASVSMDPYQTISNVQSREITFFFI